MKFKHLLYSITGAAFLLAATSKPVSIPSMFSNPMTLEDKPLEVSAKIYSSEESEHILHADLVGKGYVPVEITIQNQGDHSYAISAASTAMRSSKPQAIAKKLMKGAFFRGMGLRVLSFFFWPVMIPSAFDSIHTFKKKGSLVKVLSAKGFKEKDEIVLPYSLVKRVLYIPKEAFYERFSVSLQDLNSKELVVIPVLAC